MLAEVSLIMCKHCAGCGFVCEDCGRPIGGDIPDVQCVCDVTKDYDTEFMVACDECHGAGQRGTVAGMACADA